MATPFANAYRTSLIVLSGDLQHAISHMREARQRASLQIHLPQLGAVVKLGSRSAEGDAAVAEDVDAVGDLQDRTDFPLDDQDGDWAGGGTRTLYRRPTGLIEAI